MPTKSATRRRSAIKIKGGKRRKSASRASSRSKPRAAKKSKSRSRRRSRKVQQGGWAMTSSRPAVKIDLATEYNKRLGF